MFSFKRTDAQYPMVLMVDTQLAEDHKDYRQVFYRESEADPKVKRLFELSRHTNRDAFIDLVATLPHWTVLNGDSSGRSVTDALQH